MMDVIGYNLRGWTQMKREKLVQARVDKEWTIEQAAEQIGCAVNTLSRWELGKMKPSAHNIARLCKAYGKEATQLDLVEDEVPYPLLPLKSTKNLQRHLYADLSLHLMTITLTPHQQSQT